MVAAFLNLSQNAIFSEICIFPTCAWEISQRRLANTKTEFSKEFLIFTVSTTWELDLLIVLCIKG